MKCKDLTPNITLLKFLIRPIAMLDQANINWFTLMTKKKTNQRQRQLMINKLHKIAIKITLTKRRELNLTDQTSLLPNLNIMMRRSTNLSIISLNIRKRLNLFIIKANTVSIMMLIHNSTKQVKNHFHWTHQLIMTISNHCMRSQSTINQFILFKLIMMITNHSHKFSLMKKLSMKSNHFILTTSPHHNHSQVIMIVNLNWMQFLIRKINLNQLLCLIITKMKCPLLINTMRILQAQFSIIKSNSKILILKISLYSKIMIKLTMSMISNKMSKIMMINDHIIDSWI